MSDRVIVAVKYTPVAAPGGMRRAIGAFLRYVQYRDKHADEGGPLPDTKVDGMLRYVAHRDRAAGHGRLFDASGAAGDQERRALAAFVARAAAATRPQLTCGRDGKLADRRRAVYRFVISPEHADGLDLRRLTSAAVAQLEADAGGAVRWIAAEHRNTAHPHVHLIVAGFRGTEAGGFRSLVLTKPRLQRMKEATIAELVRQRELRRFREQAAPEAVPATPAPMTSSPSAATTGTARRRPSRTPKIARKAGQHSGGLQLLNGGTLRRLAAKYRRDAEREGIDRHLGWEPAA